MEAAISESSTLLVRWRRTCNRYFPMAKPYNAIIIGTRQAGPFLAQRLAEAAGMKVAIIQRKLFGGTCINTGCTPTKTMIASAPTTLGELQPLSDAVAAAR